MTTKEFMISMFSKLYEQQKLIFDLTVADQALLSAVKEAFPNLAYERHLRDSMRTELTKKALETLRQSAETLEK